MKNKGQKFRILEDLLKGMEVDMLKDIERYGSSCRSRISELRAMGYPIEDYYNESNGGRYKTYFLPRRFLEDYHAQRESA